MRILLLFEHVPPAPVRTPLAYLELAVRARRHRPDVVYAHFLVPTGLAARLTGIPYVITAHGSDVANAEARPG